LGTIDSESLSCLDPAERYILHVSTLRRREFGVPGRDLSSRK
jgi:hypothetical protein